MLTDIQRQLETLAEMQQMRTALTAAYEHEKQQAIPPEVHQALADLEVEYAPLFGAANASIEAAEQAIKAAVTQHGAKVTGGGLMAQFNHGRVTYDSKRLDGLALAFPQINECKRLGEPFVTLKPVKP